MTKEEIAALEAERDQLKSVLNAVLLYGKECPECKAPVIVDHHFYSLQHRDPCEIGNLAGMSIAR